MRCTLYPDGPILGLHMATIGENLKRIRNERGLQQGEVADKVGVPQSQLSRWETDFAVPDTASILRIAPALEATVEEIFAGVDESYDAVVRRRMAPQTPPHPLTAGVPGEAGRNEFQLVPVLAGRIAAGPPLRVDDHDIDGHIPFSAEFMAHFGQVAKPICVRVGRFERSMFPTIRPGDTVLLDCSDPKRENPRNGRIYAVNVEEGSTLKRIVVAGGTLTLLSDNLDKDEYPARTIECEGDTELRNLIVGEAVWCGTLL